MCFRAYHQSQRIRDGYGTRLDVNELEIPYVAAFFLEYSQDESHPLAEKRYLKFIHLLVIIR